MTRLLTILLVLASSALAQELAPRGDRTSTTRHTEAALASGGKALARGDRAEAAVHFQRALRDDPWNETALRRLLQVAGEDAGARALWAHAHALAAIDARGKLRIGRKVRALYPAENPHPEELARLRVAALGELRRFLETERRRLTREGGGAGLLARWGREVAGELLRGSPALARAFGADLDKQLGPPPRPDREVISDLRNLLANANDQPDVALRAAHCLRGLAAQAGFKDLKGEKAPKMDDEARNAAARVARTREQLRGTEGAPLTVEQLEAMSPPERDAFGEEHASFTNPGVAISPNGLYRIETVCGHDTLLGVARTIEMHHARLASWYGVDPFRRQPGLVRVVPEAWGLESEGTPYWWAGGFQRGQVTTVKFAVGRIEGLGHALTHELTHRFDGTIYPFLPGWLVEGRAVWTAGAYANSEDERFVDNHVSFGTMESAMLKGYGGRENLERLIKGTIEDYRDNYVAGYALWVYLSTWKEGERLLYGKRLRRYLKEAAKGRRKPLKWFASNFVDGKEGRPETMDAFATAFAEFLRGFYWLSRAPWTDRYTTKVGKRKREGFVYDTATWIYSRSRAEPVFGQDQARRAGDLFYDQGLPDQACRAYLWSLEVDEWRPRVVGRVVDLLGKKRRSALAWLVRHEMRRRRGDEDEAGAPVPYLARLPRTRAVLEARAAAAAFYHEHGRPLAEAAMVADHARLAGSLGLGELTFDGELTRDALALHPLDEPPRTLAVHGLIEDELTGFDEYRVAGLWYTTPEGDVHVGRKKPREGTGTMDRNAHRRHAFTRSKLWLPAGRYRLSTRIFFTTSYVTGAVVVGYGRRDRNVRFTFQAGDYMYSIGQSKEAPKFESFGWSIRGQRDRNHGLPGSVPGGSFGFRYAKPSFKLDLTVDGPHVHAFVDDRFVGTYHTVDGLPVEGFVGFATSWGAVRVQTPTIQRLDRSARTMEDPLRGLDPSLESSARLHELRNRRVHGIPRDPYGTVVVWVPRSSPDELDVDDVVGTAATTFRATVAALARDRYRQLVVLAIPEGIPDDVVRRLEDSVPELAAGNVPIVTHRRLEYLLDLERPNMPGEPMPLLLYVDPHGALRAGSLYLTGPARLPWSIWHWCRVFRDGYDR